MVRDSYDLRVPDILQTTYQIPNNITKIENVENELSMPKLVSDSQNM